MGATLLALLALSPALGRAETISGKTTKLASGDVRFPAFQAPLVAWLDATSNEFMYYDESDGSTHALGCSAVEPQR